MQEANEALSSTFVSNERSNKSTTLYKILDSQGFGIHTFYKRTIEEAEAYYVNYCVKTNLQLSKHMLMSVGV